MLDTAIASTIIPTFPLAEVVPELGLILKGPFAGGVFLDLHVRTLSERSFSCIEDA